MLRTIPLTGGPIPVSAVDVGIGAAYFLPTRPQSTAPSRGLDSSNGQVFVKLGCQMRAGAGGSSRVGLAIVRADGSLEAIPRTRMTRGATTYDRLVSRDFIAVQLRGNEQGFQLVGQSVATAGDVVGPTLLLDDRA